MARSSRTDAAANRAKFARAARLQREAAERGEAPKPQKPRPSPEPPPERTRTPKDGRDPRQKAQRPGRPVPRRQDEFRPEDARSPERQSREMKRRARAVDGRPAMFNGLADRRQQHERRATFERQRQRVQGAVQRFEGQRQADQRQREDRRRQQVRKDLAKVADRRQDHARRAEQIRKAAELAAQRKDHARRAAAELTVRQKEQQRQAAAHVEAEQKRRAQNQHTAHRRMTDEMRRRHGVDRHGFHDAKEQAELRHHRGLNASLERQDRELAEFDGRRKGLAGRAAELIGRTGSRNDRQRDAIIVRHEQERRIAIRDHEALQARQLANEQKARLARMAEQKALFELIRDDRERTGRAFAAERPQLIEARTRITERAEQMQQERDREQDREREKPTRENVRPGEDFARAAQYSREAAAVPEPAPTGSALPREAGREISGARVLERV